jgi:site-specific recombinase XerC
MGLPWTVAFDAQSVRVTCLFLRNCTRFKEKGGKEKELPVHHKLEELLDEYLKAAGLEQEPESPLFPVVIGKTGCRNALKS